MEVNRIPVSVTWRFLDQRRSVGSPCPWRNVFCTKGGQLDHSSAKGSRASLEFSDFSSKNTYLFVKKNIFPLPHYSARPCRLKAGFGLVLKKNPKYLIKSNELLFMRNPNNRSPKNSQTAGSEQQERRPCSQSPTIIRCWETLLVSRLTKCKSV